MNRNIPFAAGVFVAPHAGARIEIIRWIFCGRYSPAAPFAGARIKTFFLLVHVYIIHRRTLRGCVSQNNLRITLVIVMTVAPYAGARIETFQRHVHAVLFWSRALRGCANRNGKAKAAKTISGLRTSRGCANRNGIYCRGRDVAPHAGARIEIARFPVAPCFLPSHSVRVRESKCPAPENAKGLLPSHPARVRESKSGKCDYLGNPNVAPHAGARIEIQINPAGRCCRSSHLSHGYVNQNTPS